MARVIGWLALIVGLLVSVGLHEVGHMLPAKRFGVRVSQFMIGFGPTLWSRRRGETEYGLKAILLGGYVRMIGMFPPASVTGARPRAGRIGEIVQATRDASAEDVLPGDEHRAFYRLSTPKKLVVMLGGPVMNLLIAAVLMAVVLVGLGIPAATTTVGVVGECVVPNDAPPDYECTADDLPYPAAGAGLLAGDVIVGYGGRDVATWDELTAAIRAVPIGKTPLVVERDGERVSLEITPISQDRPLLGEDGAPVLDAAGQPVTGPTPILGFNPALADARQPWSSVPGEVAAGVVGTGEIIWTLPQRLVDVTQAAMGQEERDPNSVVGLVGVGRISGDIFAADAAFADQLRYFLSLLASLNIALFAFNLLPLLPLDGGHVVAALWEGAKRQVARWRGAPRPAPADVALMMPIAYGVVGALLVMTVVLVWADLVAPVTLG